MCEVNCERSVKDMHSFIRELTLLIAFWDHFFSEESDRIGAGGKIDKFPKIQIGLIKIYFFNQYEWADFKAGILVINLSLTIGVELWLKSGAWAKQLGDGRYVIFGLMCDFLVLENENFRI